MNVPTSVLRRLRLFGLAFALCAGLAACVGKGADELLASAKNYLAKNDLNSGIIELKNALQKQPDLAEARFLLGKALLDREDPAAAEAELRKASDLKFPADSVVPLLAKALLQQGDSRKVVEQFRPVALNTPEATAELKTLLATAYTELGARKEADAALDAALQAMPDHGPAMVLKARLLAGQGNLEAAMDLATKALQKAPADSVALQLKGDLLLYGKRDWQAALVAYRAAIAADNANYAARGAIISGLMIRNEQQAAKQELEALRKLRPNHPQTRFFDAGMAFLKADYKGAEEQVQQLLKMVPRSPQALHLAAALAYRKGSLVQAEQHLAKALAVMPEFVNARLLLAQTYMRSGQPTKALDTIRPLLEAKEPMARALSIAGAAYMQSGDNNKAQGFFERAVKLDPTDSKSRTALALKGLSQGEGTAAFGELESISQSDSDTNADMVLINVHLAKRNFDAALKAIDRLETKQPGKPFPHYVRGRALLERGDLSGARSSFEKAAALDPLFFPATETLAALDLRDKKPADAEKRFESVLKVEPNHVQALMASARLKAQAHKGKDEVVALLARAIAASPSDLAPRLMQVNYLLQQADYKAALNAAQDASAAFPDSPEVLGALGRAQMASGDLNQAINSFTKVSRLLPQSPLPLIALAEAHIATRNNAAAAESLKRALAVAPRNLAVQQKSMELQLATGRLNEAIATARNVQMQRPKEAVGLSMEGDVELVRKNWAAAATAYRNALQREPSTTIAQRLQLSLRAAGDPVKADAFAAGWVKAHPQDAAFVLFLADLAVKERKYDVAESQLKQVLRLAPDDASALNNLAWVLSTQTKPGALEAAERANQISPDRPEFMDTLAMVLADQGKLPRALEIQKKAVELEPNAHALRLRLARLYVQSGEKTAARKELDSLAQLGDKFPRQGEVREMLAKL